MKVEVDQSGKIEDTKTATVLALSNNIQFSVFISAVIKRKVLTKFRKIYPPKFFYQQFFVIGLFLLLKNHLGSHSIIIDKEYFSKEKSIKEHLLNLFKQNNIPINPEQIDFAEIGKKSNAHLKALFDFRKNKADKKIKTEEIIKFFPKKRPGIPCGRKPTYSVR